MVAFTSSVCAQNFDAVRLHAAMPGQSGGQVGIAFVADAAYAGSKDRDNTWRPVLDYQWANGWFAGTSNGIGVNMSQRTEFQFGPRLTFDIGRKESQSTRLHGMGDIKPRPEVGAFLNYSPTPEVSLSSSLRYGSGQDRNGLVVDAGAVYTVVLQPSTRVSLGVGASYANAQHQSYFEVNSSQSLASGLSTYVAGAGLRDVRLQASVLHTISPALSITGSLTVRELLNDAAHSPLTQRRTQTSAVVALVYAM